MIHGINTDSVVVDDFFFFFLRMGIQNVHNVPFLESASLKKRKRNMMKRIKQFYKI